MTKKRIRALYFRTLCFDSALLCIVVFFLYITRIFVVSDGSSKTPSFHLPVVPRKLPVLTTLEKHNRPLVLHSKECDQSSSLWIYSPFSSQLSPLLLTYHLLELRVDKGNSNASAGLVRPADDGHLGDYISYVLLHVLVDILNTFSHLKRRQRNITKRIIYCFSK